MSAFWESLATGGWLRLDCLRLELRPKVARRRLAAGRPGDRQPGTSDKRPVTSSQGPVAWTSALKPAEAVVERLPFHQLGMGTAFDDAAAVQDQDSVGMTDGG